MTSLLERINDPGIQELIWQNNVNLWRRINRSPTLLERLRDGTIQKNAKRNAMQARSKFNKQTFATQENSQDFEDHPDGVFG